MLPSGLDVYPHDPRSWTGSSELDKLMYFCIGVFKLFQPAMVLVKGKLSGN